MRKFTLALILSACFIFTTLQAQNATIKNGISYSVVRMDYAGPFEDDFSFGDEHLTTGVIIGYHRNLAGNFLNLEVPVKIGAVRLPGGDNPFGQQDFAAGLDALLQLQWSNGRNAIIPYLSAGIGGLHVEDQDFDTQVPAGVGLDLRVGKGIYLRGRSEYRFSFTDDRNNWNHIFGLKAIFGKTEKPEEPPVEVVPTDTDGDGITDDQDKCPEVAGVAAFEGCPDSDADGVADADDDCPTVAGLSKFRGCPDSDGDGLMDSKDNCPQEAGPADNNGCPFADTDGDGVIDKDDDCPNAKGLAKNNGCPDSDGDSVIDKKDKCPNQAGPVSNQGCPELEEEEKEVLNFAAQAIQFNTSSAVIKTESYGILNQVAEILNKYPAYKCSISGHTDSQGNEASNQKLSEKRARACYDYLINQGVLSSRLSYAGYGETQPIADNRYESGRKQNRRVVFEIKL